MTPDKSLIDQHVTDSAVMLARLGDHLMTLDGLRDSQKNSALGHFGLKAKPEAYEGNLRKLVSSHIERYDAHMGGYLRYAHVLLVYMVFEDRLHAFGQVISATRRGDHFNPKKWKGSLLDKFEGYLGSLPIEAPQKSDVEILRLIRNCLVHCGGCVTESSDCEVLQRLIPTLVGVTIDEQDHIALTTEGCLKLQEGVIQYLQAIESAAGFHLWIPPEVRKNFEEHILPHLSDTTNFIPPDTKA